VGIGDNDLTAVSAARDHRLFFRNACHFTKLPIQGSDPVG
jgi:hypothetical protein